VKAVCVLEADPPEDDVGQVEWKGAQEEMNQELQPEKKTVLGSLDRKRGKKIPPFA
jgi:hypothetical protein